MNIRKAIDSDKKEVINFCQNTFVWGDYIDKVWDLWLNDPSGVLFVLEVINSVNSQLVPIAISHFSSCPNKLMWIEGVRVNKKYRKQGFAFSLLKYVLDYGKRNDFEEASAVVSCNNVASQKMLEKHCFHKLSKFNYYNLQFKRNDQSRYPPSQLRIRFRIPYYADIVSIIDYFNHFGIQCTMNRYFKSWKFYKFNNNYADLLSLIVKNKVLLVVDELNQIKGIVIVNLVDDNNGNVLYPKKIIQICYLNCIDYSFYLEVIKQLIYVYSIGNRFHGIQFFIPLFELNDNYFNDKINCFEQFFIYSKNLR